MNPGHHVILASALGAAERRYEVDLEEGETRSIEVRPGVLQSPAPAAAVVLSPKVELAPVMPAAKPPSHPGSTRRTLAIASAGVGVAGLAVGAVFGAAALAKRNGMTAGGHCTPEGGCDSPGALRQWNADRGNAQTLGNVSTTTFIVGGVGLVAGAVLWWTLPRGNAAGTGRAPWQIGVDVGALELRREW